MADKNYINPALIKEFVAEFTEHVQSLELNILALEKAPENLDLINDIFRSMHTLKGTSALMGFPKISEFGHRFENLLDELRKKKRAVTPEIIDLLLSSLDVIRAFVDDVTKGGNGAAVDDSQPLRSLEALLGAPAAPAPAPAPAQKSGDEIEVFLAAAQQHLRSIRHALGELEKGGAPAPWVDGVFRGVHSLKASSSFMGFDHLFAVIQDQENVLEAVRQANDRFAPDTLAQCRQFCGTVEELCALIKATGKDSAAGDTVAAPNPGDGGAVPEAVHHTANYAEQNIRVSMQKLDHLIDLTSELIISKSRFDQIGRRLERGEDAALVLRDFKDTSIAMERVTGELHTAIMDTRMVSIGTLFNRFPRTVRELARKKDREIELHTSGEDTEIDKTIIEEINDPLMHLIRNACDHGIEDPSARTAAGKPAGGTVSLRASHESGNVIIEIEDDGKGMDSALIREKAVRNGIITPAQAEEMGEQDTLNLIFLPGFSTAEKVTDISGRGVGMDVVKTNIEKLRGKVHVETEKGKGTKIILKLPLTMGMIETLMVNVGEEMFAIPILSVNAIARIQSSNIQTIQGREAVVLHGQTIDAVRLGAVLNIRQGAARQRVYLVVLAVKNSKGNDIKVGFIVDSVHDKQKIVIKPLDDALVGTRGFSGATVLGDGRVALIVDPVELVDMVGRA
jgi:two-component system chemotaxis sensor kinase CheA